MTHSQSPSPCPSPTGRQPACPTSSCGTAWTRMGRARTLAAANRNLWPQLTERCLQRCMDSPPARPAPGGSLPMCMPTLLHRPPSRPSSLALRGAWGAWGWAAPVALRRWQPHPKSPHCRLHLTGIAPKPHAPPACKCAQLKHALHLHITRGKGPAGQAQHPPCPPALPPPPGAAEPPSRALRCAAMLHWMCSTSSTYCGACGCCTAAVARTARAPPAESCLARHA
jgi:hypothetical protein